MSEKLCALRKKGGVGVRELDSNNAVVFASNKQNITYTAPSDGVVVGANYGQPTGLTMQINGNTITGYISGGIGSGSAREIAASVLSGDVVTLSSTNSAWTWLGVFYPYVD